MKKRPQVYIFDLDGTLFDVTHRLHYKEKSPPDHDSFYDACDKDTVVIPILKTLRALRDNGDVEIWYWTGRRESCREKTIECLAEYGIFFHEPSLGWAGVETLKMRPHGNREDDQKLKEKWLKELAPEERARIVAVFEDRDRVVKMWRDNGITCFQVKPGNY